MTIDNPGSGYAHAPTVVIRDGTIFDPILGATPATATATIALDLGPANVVDFRGRLYLDSAGEHNRFYRDRYRGYGRGDHRLGRSHGHHS